MDRTLTFTDLFKKLSTSKTTPESVVKDAKLFFEIATCIFGGPTATGVAAIITVISEKGKLFDAATRLIEKIHERKDGGYVGYIDRMSEAYAVICFSAYFDTLNKNLPQEIRKSIALTEKEKALFFSKNTHVNNEKLDHVVLPDIISDFQLADSQLKKIYNEISEHLTGFVHQLAFYENTGEKEKRVFDETMKKLPEAAIIAFHEQFLTLCNKFNSFLIYANAKHEIAVDSRLKEIITLARRSDAIASEGLNEIKKAIHAIEKENKNEKVSHICERIRSRYQSALEKPVLKAVGNEDLLFPPVAKAFIPQPFKLLRYMGTEKLEQKATWSHIDANDDMESFWAKYLLTPESTQRILLVLGEPGSGKSLLTEVLAGQMSKEGHLVVRIPLRAYYMERRIENIVCKQLEDDGDTIERIERFKFLAEDFSDNPITLLFDGYDEVQQATGLEYRSFIRDLEDFQIRCLEENRPIRIIVTSRSTLIDKAEIPEETLVMKLLDFDNRRIKTWVETWNNYNHNALLAAGLKDFELPVDNRDIDELSRQPLLLMMLAIYDADFENHKNALSTSSLEMNRTQLYDALLRRFVRRELNKGVRGTECAYSQSDEKQKRLMEENEIERLGIAALGMFIRGKISITANEVEADFNKFGSIGVTYENRNSRRKLRSGEIFFGSFFFIHDPGTRNDEVENDYESDSQAVAFEFLHKTFFEFLVANFILKGYLLYAAKLSKTREDNPYHFIDGFKSASHQHFARCFASLSSTCLCIDPAIIQMMKEWHGEMLCRCLRIEKAKNEESVRSVIREILPQYVKHIKNGEMEEHRIREMSLVERMHTPQMYAVFLINLVTLQTIIDKECVMNKEDWKFVSQYVKLNVPFVSTYESKRNEKRKNSFIVDPSESIVLDFMALFSVDAVDHKNELIVTMRDSILDVSAQGFLATRVVVYTFLQDNLASEVFALHDSSQNLFSKIRRIDYLETYGMDLIEERNSLLIQTIDNRLLMEKKIGAIEISNFIYNHPKSSTSKHWLNWLNRTHTLVKKYLSNMTSNSQDFDLVETALLQGTNANLTYIHGLLESCPRNKEWLSEVNAAKQISSIWIDIIALFGERLSYPILQKNLEIAHLSDTAFYQLASLICQNPRRGDWNISEMLLFFKFARDRIDQYTTANDCYPLRIAAVVKLLSAVKLITIFNSELYARVHSVKTRIIHDILCAMDNLSNVIKESIESHKVEERVMRGLPILLLECLQCGISEPVLEIMNIQGIVKAVRRLKLPSKEMYDYLLVAKEILNRGWSESIMHNAVRKIEKYDDICRIDPDLVSIVCLAPTILLSLDKGRNEYVDGIFSGVKLIMNRFADFLQVKPTETIEATKIIGMDYTFKQVFSQYQSDLNSRIASTLYQFDALLHTTSVTSATNYVIVCLLANGSIVYKVPAYNIKRLDVSELLVECISAAITANDKSSVDYLVEALDLIQRLHNNDLYSLFEWLKPMYNEIRRFSSPLANRVRKLFPVID